MAASLALCWARAAPGAARAQEASPTPGIFLPRQPTLMIQAFPSYGTAPLTVLFLLGVTDPANVGFVSYRWTFGDGHVSTLPPPFARNTYTRPGTYVVTVTAITHDGRSVTAFTGIIVRPRSSG